MAAKKATTTKIDIDLDVHRTIEANRTGFEQTPNDILRELLGLEAGQAEVVEGPSPTRVRRTGKFRIQLLGDAFEAASLKDAYLDCLRALSKSDPQFLDRLATKATRSRRIVARQKRDLYIRSPELARDFAEQLCRGWWVDTNLSRLQCKKRLEVACEVAGITYGDDLVLEFPT